MSSSHSIGSNAFWYCNHCTVPQETTEEFYKRVKYYALTPNLQAKIRIQRIGLTYCSHCTQKLANAIDRDAQTSPFEKKTLHAWKEEHGLWQDVN